MLPLAGRAVPTDHHSLAESLRAGFDALGLRPRAVEATGGTWPTVSRLAIDLTGAEASRALRPSSGFEKIGGPLLIEEFALRSQPLLIEKIPVQIDARFSSAEAECVQDDKAALFLRLVRAASGSVDIAIAHADLERTLQAMASEAAGKHGAEVKSTRLELETPTPRALIFRVAVTAKAFIMKTTIRVRGRVDLDDALNARVSGLTAEGEGILSSLVQSGLRPHLAKFEQEQFALGSFVASGLRVSDVTVSAGATVRLHATFAGASP